MPETVYLDTTVVSYLTGRLAPVNEGGKDKTRERQLLTRAWWSGPAHRFDLVASQVVIDEARKGDPWSARRRLEALQGVRILDPTRASEELKAALLDSGAVPRSEENDAEHIALAAVHGVGYLVTWNLKHIANRTMLPLIRRVCRDLGHEPPAIVKLSEMMDDGPDQISPVRAEEVKEARVGYVAELGLNVAVGFEHVRRTEQEIQRKRRKAMRQLVYVDTTVVDYLRSSISETGWHAVELQATRDWWGGPSEKVDLVAWRVVLDEARKGDPESVRMRLKALEAVTLLDPTPESEELTAALLDAGAVARDARNDAAHIALATTHGAEFLATWNRRNIFNVWKMPHIKHVCRDMGHEPPFFVTTEYLWAEDYPVDRVMAEVYAAKKACLADYRREREQAGRVRAGRGDEMWKSRS